LTGPDKYLAITAAGCIPACRGDGRTIYESKTGRQLIIYTASAIPKRLSKTLGARGVPYRAEGDGGSYIYGWLPPDYPLRPIGPRSGDDASPEEDEDGENESEGV